MAVTVIRDLALAASQQRIPMTIRGLASGDGLTYRHPDSAQVSYPEAVQAALGSVPVGGETSIAIIGAGAAGIAALYEIRQIAQANPSRKFRVKLFERDPFHFLVPQPPQGRPQVRAGRVSSYFTPDTVYEIGAMRFPSIAGLTWHYAGRVFGMNEEVYPFPNPGTVPTEFVFGDRFDRYVGGTWMDQSSPTNTGSIAD